MSVAKYIRCKPCLITTSTLVAGVIIYLIVNRNQKKKMIDQITALLDGNVPDKGQKAITDTEYAALPSGTFPIKIGQKNKKVYEIQKALNKFKGTHLDLDGVYGDSTFHSLCDNIWSAWYKIGECGVFGRRDITQADYDKVINNSSFSGASGAETAAIVDSGRNQDMMRYASN